MLVCLLRDVFVAMLLYFDPNADTSKVPCFVYSQEPVSSTQLPKPISELNQLRYEVIVLREQMVYVNVPKDGEDPEPWRRNWRELNLAENELYRDVCSSAGIMPLVDCLIDWKNKVVRRYPVRKP